MIGLGEEWWVIPVAAVLLFFGAVIAVLIYLLFRDAGTGGHSITAIVVDSEGKPVPGATVSADGKSAESDEYGKAVLRVKAGEQTVRAQSGESYVKAVVRPSENATVTLRLRKGDEKNEAEREFGKVRSAYDEIGESYNRTIPAYLLSVCAGIRDMALSGGEEGRERRLAAAQKAIKKIGAGMAERRNLTQYAKTSGLPFVKLDPPLWRGLPGEEIGGKLASLDRRITKEVGKKTFHPASVMWETARAVSKSGKVGDDIAMFILLSCESMLDNLGGYLV